MWKNSDTLVAPDIFGNSDEPINLIPRHGNRLPLVLVIDDDVDSLVLICHVLEKFACIPLCETNGQIALEVIEKHKPNLVVLDIRLPGANGLEIMRSLKTHEATCKIPIIVVTALAGQQRHGVILNGCDHYITKPYLLTDVEELLSSYLVHAA
ncbi:MAG: response regulator [Cyanobacteria bacterium J06636_16]